MKTAQKFRLASFSLDMIVISILFYSDLHWSFSLAIIVCCAVSCVFYGEYMLQRYGPKEYGSTIHPAVMAALEAPVDDEPDGYDEERV